MSISAVIRVWLLGETLQEADRLRCEKVQAFANVIGSSDALAQSIATNRKAAEATHSASREAVHDLRNRNALYSGTRTAQQALELLSRKDT